MTTRLTITHDNFQSDFALLITKQGGAQQRIEPGQWAELYVWEAAGLTVEEVPRAKAEVELPAQSFSLATIGRGFSKDDPTEHPIAEGVFHHLTPSPVLPADPVLSEHRPQADAPAAEVPAQADEAPAERPKARRASKA